QLTLRIAETAIELEHFRSVASEHQPRIQYPAVGVAFGLHAAERRPKNSLLCLLQQGVRCVGWARVAAHATRVRSPIGIEQALVVARRWHDSQAFTIREGEHRELGTFEIFLNKHHVGRAPERSATKELIHSHFELSRSGCDEHALSTR